jgi:hypothetical protein
MNRIAWLFGSLFVCAATARAQAIRGITVDQREMPVAGVVVQLIDASSGSSTRALSNERGEFYLRAPHAGRYSVRTLRIGFRPEATEPIPVADGEVVSHRIVLRNIPLSLDTLRVVATNACHAVGESDPTTFALWEQVRAAVTAAALTASARTFRATTAVYDREVDPRSRALESQELRTETDYVRQAWKAAAPESLSRAGYVQTDRSGWSTFFAPSLETLLSSSFVEDHCFRVTAANSASGPVGLAFAPNPSRKQVAEIEGTLWIDRRSAQLQRLEFRYVNLPRLQSEFAAGLMRFAPLRDGGWVVTEWAITMPVVSQSTRTSAMAIQSEVVSALKVSGGLLVVATHGSDTLWSHQSLPVSGVVLDSLSGTPVGSARVRLAASTDSTVTDAMGRFSLHPLLPGRYSLQVRTPSLDSVSAVSETPLILTDSATTLRIEIPRGGDLVGRLCRSTANKLPGIVVGSTRMPDESGPHVRTRISVEWKEISVQAEPRGAVAVNTPSRRVEAYTGADGSFRICGVPLNTELQVSAAASGFASAPVTVRIPPGGRIRRADLQLNAAAAGATYAGVVTDSLNNPVSRAEVAFPQLGRSTLTDDGGRFRFTALPAGSFQLTARRIGYSQLDAAVVLDPDRPIDQRIVLSRSQMLDSVIVEAAEVDRRMASFDENKRIGLGTFLTQEDLEKKGAASLAVVLESFGGVQIQQGKSGHVWLASGRGVQSLQHGNGATPDQKDANNGASPGGCYAQVYVDDVLMTRTPGLFDLSTLSADRIHAIEYYASPAQTPMKYSTLNSGCGVLVIWTRQD